jgi:hypothetical protein
MLFGGAGIAITLALLVAAAAQPDCYLSARTIQPVFGVQLCLAGAAGFATNYRAAHSANQPMMAGFGSSALTSLSGLIFFGLGLTHVLPELCYEELRGLGVLFVSLVLIFAMPVEAAGGAFAGWLGGRLARAV